MVRFFLYIVIIMLLQPGAHAQPPSNPIFFGGMANGWQMGSFAPALRPVHTTGGPGNGWGQAGLVQPAASIHLGGSGNGWQMNSWQQGYSGITRGGPGNGWSMAGRLQDYTGIVKGGAGNGWAGEGRRQDYSGIVKGGPGNGWNMKDTAQSYSNFPVRGGSGNGWASADIKQQYILITKGGAGNGWAMSVGLDIITDPPRNAPPAPVLAAEEKPAAPPLQSQSEFKYRLYPNPVQDQLHLRLEGLQPESQVRIVLLDAGGRQMFLQSYTLSKDPITINVSRLAKGMYFLQLESGNRRGVVKFVKE